jgi:hypothetical protein
MNLGAVTTLISAGTLVRKCPADNYVEWLRDVHTQEPLFAFLREYMPHGERLVGTLTLIGVTSMMSIDEQYQTTRDGRFAIFAQTGDGSYAGVNVDTGEVGWIMVGHLEPDELVEGFVPYPGGIGDFLLGADNDEDFPFDPFEAMKRYGMQ